MPQGLTRSVDVHVDAPHGLFTTRDTDGSTLTVDMSNKLQLAPNGHGFAARDLLLVALAGCSGSSFVAAMQENGQRFDGLTIQVSGVIDAKPPQVFRSIVMRFRITGDEVDDDAVARSLGACFGSCSIAATLSHVATIDTEYEVVRSAVAPRREGAPA